MRANKSLPMFIQFLKFGIVGGINTISSLLIYYLLLYFEWSYLLANVVGYFASSLGGYFLNKFWVFESKGLEHKNSIAKYYIIYGTSFLLNISTMYLWVDLLKVPETLAPILTILITLPYNFILNKTWAFKNKKIINNNPS